MSTTYTVSLGEGADVPMSAEHIRAAYSAGTIHARTLVWRDGLSEWMPIGSLADEIGIETAHVAIATPAVAAPPLPRAQALAKAAYTQEKYRAAEAKKRMSRSAVVAWVALIVVGVGAFTPALLKWWEVMKMKSALEAVIKDSMKSPKSAEVTFTTVEIGTTSGAMRGYVDSQNSFGAMLRSDWEATFEKDESQQKWKATSLRIGNQKAEAKK